MDRDTDGIGGLCRHRTFGRDGSGARDCVRGRCRCLQRPVWLFIAAAMVMFMQAGFALVEAGFTRATNADNIIMRNLMDFSVGGLTYWAFGFALAYGGASLAGLIGYGDV